jgi:hypothetical protein
MNKKAQSTGLAIMGLIFFAIIGLTCVNFFFDGVTTARTELNCDNANDITDGSKLLCLVVDLSIPYWIWIILSVAIGFVLVKVNL